ncbi:DUF4174 domain-containing protein [Novosphingobium sp.]|uniref:DUF4174 domain-containing protein n=1 Tax=Novosphingobium sp. TaxID=1874826 RepID=UPI00334093F0
MMIPIRPSITLAAIAMPVLATAALPPIATLRWHKRVVLIAAPDANDPSASEQRAILAAWHQGAEDRDIAVVEIAGSAVSGAGDAAPALRRRYRLEPARFTVLLIGKDGQVAVRADRPIAADRLQRVIDAMPMRRAGER